jgi:hypothetical protein
MATVNLPSILVLTSSDTDQASTQQVRLLSVTTGDDIGAAISRFSVEGSYEDVVS